MRRVTALVIAAALAVSAPALAGGAAAPLVPQTIVAADRLATPNGSVQMFTSNTNRVGPWHYALRRTLPLAALNGAQGYQSCVLGFSNWMQNAGLSTTINSTTTSGNKTLTSLASSPITALVWPGDTVSVTNLPTPAKIVSVDSSSQVTINQTATGSAANTATYTSSPASYGTSSGEIDSVGDAIIVGAVGIVAPQGAGTQPISVRFGGQPWVSIAPGTTAYSDPFTLGINPNTTTTVEVRNDVWWDAQTEVAGNEPYRSDLGDGYDYATATAPVYGTSTDQALAVLPTYSKSATVWNYGPSTLFCTALAPPGANRGFMILGDSLEQGAADVYLPAGVTSVIAHGDANGNLGIASRLLANNGFGYVNASQSGKQLANFITANADTMDLAHHGVTDVIIELCKNDFANSVSAATMETNIVKAANMFVAAGIRPWVATCTTETTSIDGLITTGNQTPTAGFTVGGAEQAYNDWLRSTGASAGTVFNGRILDYADATMSARDSQVWRVDHAPFADLWGTLITTTFVAGSGATNGTYPITASGGGCTTEPVISAIVTGNAIVSVAVTNVGVGCTSTPTFSTASIIGLSGGSITAVVKAQGTAIHPRTFTDAAGNTVDANGVTATYLQTQFVADLAYP